MVHGAACRVGCINAPCRQLCGRRPANQCLSQHHSRVKQLKVCCPLLPFSRTLWAPEQGLQCNPGYSWFSCLTDDIKGTMWCHHACAALHIMAAGVQNECEANQLPFQRYRATGGAALYSPVHAGVNTCIMTIRPSSP